MANLLFLRETEVLVAGMVFAEPMYRINFKINFNYDEDPDPSEIEILNLSNDTISKIKKAQNVVVNAGYYGDVGTIFEGDIQRVELDVDVVDRRLKIYALAANEAYMNATINKAYAAGITADQLILDMLYSIGLQIGYFELKKNVTYVSGKVCSGNLRNILRQIVQNDCQSKIYFINGKIIIRPDGTGDNIGFLLNSDTGLISSPSKVDKTSSDGIQTADYSVKTLLNHRVTTDSIFQIESRTANGLFRVNKGTHTKSDSDFTTECEVVAV